jgi:cytochrome c
MKKLFLVACAVTFINTMATMGQSAPAAKPATAPKVELNGEALMAKSDCMVCHQLHKAVIGPAYDKVAEKYKPTEENIKMLSEKVINGGTGVWGTMPMAPHPTLKPEEARAMVKYILTIKPE